MYHLSYAISIKLLYCIKLSIEIYLFYLPIFINLINCKLDTLRTLHLLLITLRVTHLYVYPNKTTLTKVI